MPSVSLCIPHNGKVPPEAFRSILTMQGGAPQHTFYHCEIDGQIVGKARNDLVRLSLSSNAEVIWFIDDDIVLPPGAWSLVDRALELGIVSGLYFNRRPPYTPQIYTKAQESKYQGPNTVYWPVEKYDEGLMVVDACGGGCLAIRADVFKKLEIHHNEHLEAIKAAAARLGTGPDVELLKNSRPTMSPWFEFTDVKGEDLYFCERAKEAGFTVWCDTTVKCQHISTVAINEGHYKYLVEHGLIKRIG